MGAFGLHACQEALEVDDEALMRAACDKLGLIDRLRLEGNPASIHRHDSGFNPHAHTDRAGLEMLDGDPGPNARLARLKLLRNGTNRSRLEPMAEDRSRKDRHTSIFESVGGMLGSDDVLDAANLPHAHVAHEPHFTGHSAWNGD